MKIFIKWFFSGLFLFLWIFVWYFVLFAALTWTNVPSVNTETPMTATLWNNAMSNLKNNIDSLDTRLIIEESKVIFYAERITTTAAAVWNMLYDTNIINIWWWTYSSTTWIYTIPKTWIYKLCLRTWYIAGSVWNRIQIWGVNKLYWRTWRWAWNTRRDWQLTDYTCWIYSINQGINVNVYSEAASVLCRTSRLCSFSVEKIN